MHESGKQGVLPEAGVALVAITPGNPTGKPVITEPEPWVL